MISVLPATTTAQQLVLLQNHDILPGYDRLYRADEGGEEIGWISMRMDGDRVTIMQMEVLHCEDVDNPTDDDKLLVELMVRAASVYALNRMILTVQYDVPEFRSVLKPFGFAEDEDGRFCIEVSRLIHRCGHCGEGKSEPNNE